MGKLYSFSTTHCYDRRVRKRGYSLATLHRFFHYGFDRRSQWKHTTTLFGQRHRAESPSCHVRDIRKRRSKFQYCNWGDKNRRNRNLEEFRTYYSLGRKHTLSTRSVHL